LWAGNGYTVSPLHRRKRKAQQHESVETGFALGDRCHGEIESKNGAPLRRRLILIAQQRYFDQGLTEDEVREKMGGKIYGPLEEVIA
jgi:hypothetical protein